MEMVLHGASAHGSEHSCGKGIVVVVWNEGKLTQQMHVSKRETDYAKNYINIRVFFCIVKRGGYENYKGSYPNRISVHQLLDRSQCVLMKSMALKNSSS